MTENIVLMLQLERENKTEILHLKNVLVSKVNIIMIYVSKLNEQGKAEKQNFFLF